MSSHDDNINDIIHQPPIYVTLVYGPRGVQVAARHADKASIAAYGRTLPAKVAAMQEANEGLDELKRAYKQQLLVTAAATGELDAATRNWRARVQMHLAGLGVEDGTITETQATDVVLVNARSLIALFEHREAELPDAAEARAELESMYSSTAKALEASQAARVAVQHKQRELRTRCAAVHRELVLLRQAVRRVLGWRHLDYQYLRVRNGAATEPPLPDDETGAEGTDSSDGAERPSSVG